MFLFVTCVDRSQYSCFLKNRCDERSKQRFRWESDWRLEAERHKEEAERLKRQVEVLETSVERQWEEIKDRDNTMKRYDCALWKHNFSFGIFSNECICAWKNNGKSLWTSSTWKSLHYRQICDLEAMHEELSKTNSELNQTRRELVHSTAQKEKISSQVMLVTEERLPVGAQLRVTSIFLKVCHLVAVH